MRAIIKKIMIVSLVMVAGGVATKASDSSGTENHPQNYYRLYTDNVKLLPLSDKGLSDNEIMKLAKRKEKEKKRPYKITFGRECPTPLFHSKLSGAKGNCDYYETPITLLEERGVDRTAAVKIGIPLPEGAVYSMRHLAILSPEKGKMPASFSATALWPDGSARWIITDFSAPLKANEQASYYFAYGNNINTDRNKTGLQITEENGNITIDTGCLKTQINTEIFSLLGDTYYDSNGDGNYAQEEKRGRFAQEGIVLVDETGEIFSSSGLKPDRVYFEEKNDQKAVLLISGKYGSKDKNKNLMKYVVRICFMANSSIIRFKITHINNEIKHEFTDFTSHSISFIPSFTSNNLLVHKFKVEEGDVKNNFWDTADSDRYFQKTDLDLSINGKQTNAKMSGAFATGGQDNGISVAIKDCWQRWPKAISIQPGRIKLELLPELPSKDFGTKLPYYLQFPFCEGKYRLKWGMSFTEDFAFDFSTGNTLQKTQELEAEINKPVIAVLPASYYAHAGIKIWQGKQFSAWDNFIKKSFNRLMWSKSKQREYGFLNYGDWFGERHRNWGNNEYDLAHGLFQDFIRTGNREHFRWAIKAAAHQADSDIIHAYPDPYYVGANAQHSIGHTGVWQGPGKPKRAQWSHPHDEHTSAENGHTWNRGMLDAWYMYGESRVMQATLELGEHIIWAMAPSFKRLTTHERSAGWSLVAICQMYNYNRDPLYLEAADKIAKIALDNQRFDHGGAWAHRMYTDHARFLENSDGNALFLIGILLNGLREYHLITDRDDVKKSILSGAKWLSMCWSEENVGWPYTASWDGKPYWPAKSSAVDMQISPAVMYAALLVDNLNQYKIACKGMFSSMLAGCDINGKELAQMACFAYDQMNDTLAFQEKHPELHKNILVDYDIAGFFAKLSGTNFSLRAPNEKMFILKQNATPGNIFLERIEIWTRSNIPPQGKITIQNNTGKILTDIPFGNKENFTKTVETPEDVSKVFILKASDYQTALWNVDYKPGEIWAAISRGASIGLCGVHKFYITVPANVNEFSITVRGVHPGNYGCVILDENGKEKTIAEGYNKYGVYLPWARKDEKVDFIREKVLTVKNIKNAKNLVWSIGLWGRGDVFIKINGIPALISNKPFIADKEVMGLAEK